VRLKSDDLIWRELDGRLVMLKLDSSLYFEVNETGTLILDKLREDTERDDLIALLVARYGLAEAQAQADVDGFVDHLRQHDLLDEAEQ
jgi:hypothetical protein